MRHLTTIALTVAFVTLALTGYGAQSAIGGAALRGQVAVSANQQARTTQRVATISPSGAPSTWTDRRAKRCPCSLFATHATPAFASSGDAKAVEVGIKFTADVSGSITGIRFYKGPKNVGRHSGSLWSSSGQLLATAAFGNETASGWQQVLFVKPVSIAAGTVYVASYHTNTGNYSYTAQAFATSVNNVPLHAPASASVNGNGVYAYGASRFPTQSFNATNYWVDVIFDTHNPIPTAQHPVVFPAARWANIAPRQVSTNFNHPPNNYGFQAIAVDPLHPSTLYLGTCYQGLWKTRDGGKTWFKVNTGANGAILNTGRLWSIAIDHFHPQTLYVADGYGYGQGVWKSTDGGVDWQQMLPATSTVEQRTSYDVHTIAIDPYRSGHLLVTFHSGWHGMKAPAGILESFDGGATWTIHQPQLSWGGDDSAFFLNNSSTWLLGTLVDGLWRTIDSGHTWAKVARANRADGPWGIYQATNGVWYAGTLHGLLRSADDGRSWTGVDLGLNAGMYYTVVGDGQYLYAQAVILGAHSPTPYIYAPESSGAGWMPYNNQTFTSGPFGMAYDPVHHIVYSSNWLDGVWKLQVKSLHPASHR